jgi:hypothetical protein
VLSVTKLLLVRRLHDGYFSVTDASDGRGSLPLLLSVVCQYQNSNAQQGLDDNSSGNAGSSVATSSMLNVLLKTSILR